MWLRCTAGAARGSREVRWIALAALLLAARGPVGDAAPRGLQCNESREVELNDELRIELWMPPPPTPTHAGFAWESRRPCDEICEWRLTATEEWAWLLIRFEHPPEGPSIDLLDLATAGGTNRTFGEVGDIDGAVAGAGEEALLASPSESRSQVELEVLWPRPDGTWLNTRLRDYYLARASRMKVPASRVVLRLRNLGCASSSARAAAAADFIPQDDLTPTPFPAPRARRLAVAVVAGAPAASAAAAATFIDISHNPNHWHVFAIIMGGCFGAALVFLLASCLCCDWHRRRHRKSHRFNHPPTPRGIRPPEDRNSLMQAFNNFVRISRREPDDWNRAHTMDDLEGSGADSREALYRGPGSFTVAWSSQGPDYGRMWWKAKVKGAEMSWAEAEAALEDDASLEWLLSRLDRLVLSFRGSDCSSIASSDGVSALPAYFYKGSLLSTTSLESKATVTMKTAAATITPASPDATAVTTSTTTTAAPTSYSPPQQSPNLAPLTIPAQTTTVPLPIMSHTPEVWWSPRSSVRSHRFRRDSSNSSLYSRISDSSYFTPMHTPPPNSPPLAAPLPSPPPHSSTPSSTTTPSLASRLWKR